jgi:hypothetical protein
VFGQDIVGNAHNVCGNPAPRAPISFAARLDVRTVLDVVGRPKAFSRHIIPLVEQGVERLEDQRLFFDSLD